MARMRFAQEMINFQEDDIGRQLEAIFAELIAFTKQKYEENKKNKEVTIKIIERSAFPSRLKDLCMQRFGLHLEFDLADSFGSPFIEVLALSNQHVFVEEMWHGKSLYDYESKITNLLKSHEGTVDLAKAKVTGIFSENKHRLAINIIEMIEDYELTASMLTGICLHEIGHAFTWYEYSDRLSSTNQILANLATEIRTTDKPEKREYWFRELAKNMDKPPEAFEDLINEKNRTVLGYKLFQVYMQSTGSQLPNARYDRTSSEQMADNFAARFGYGRQAVEGLDQIYKAVGAPERNGFVAFLFILGEIITLSYGIILIVSFITVAISPLSIFMAMFFSLYLYIIVMSSGEDLRDFTYDDLKVRYKRIRQQYIERLKNTSLKPETVKAIIADINRMDEIDKQTMNRISLIRSISNLIFAANRNSKRAIEQQQLIEDLAHSDLFLKSAELKTLH